MVGLSTFQSGPKRSKRVRNDQPDVFDHLGLFWACLDAYGPFQTKNDFMLKSISAKSSYFVLMGQQIDFCLKWSKSVQIGPKGYHIVKTSRLTILDPFEPLRNVYKPAMFGHFCPIYWCVFLGHPVVLNLIILRINRQVDETVNIVNIMNIVNIVKIVESTSPHHFIIILIILRIGRQAKERLNLFTSCHHHLIPSSS